MPAVLSVSKGAERARPAESGYVDSWEKYCEHKGTEKWADLSDSDDSPRRSGSQEAQLLAETESSTSMKGLGTLQGEQAAVDELKLFDPCTGHNCVCIFAEKIQGGAMTRSLFLSCVVLTCLAAGNASEAVECPAGSEGTCKGSEPLDNEVLLQAKTRVDDDEASKMTEEEALDEDEALDEELEGEEVEGRPPRIVSVAGEMSGAFRAVKDSRPWYSELPAGSDTTGASIAFHVTCQASGNIAFKARTLSTVQGNNGFKLQVDDGTPVNFDTARCGGGFCNAPSPHVSAAPNWHFSPMSSMIQMTPGDHIVKLVGSVDGMKVRELILYNRGAKAVQAGCTWKAVCPASGCNGCWLGGIGRCNDDAVATKTKCEGSPIRVWCREAYQDAGQGTCVRGPGSQGCPHNFMNHGSLSVDECKAACSEFSWCQAISWKTTTCAIHITGAAVPSTPTGWDNPWDYASGTCDSSTKPPCEGPVTHGVGGSSSWHCYIKDN